MQPLAVESAHLFLEVNIPRKKTDNKVRKVTHTHTNTKKKKKKKVIFISFSMTGLVIYKVSSGTFLLDYSTQAE